MWLDMYQHLGQKWQQKKWWSLGILAVLTLGFIIGWGVKPMAVKQSSTGSQRIMATATSRSINSPSKVKQRSAQAALIVDVKGAVKQPGVYTCPPASRLQKALQQAGGATDQADLSKLNLAQPLKDGLLVYVPMKGEQVVTSANPATYQSTSDRLPLREGDNGKINLNTADEHMLQKIAGIGQKRAEEIVTYRQEHGPFTDIMQLKEISGIGEKTVAKLVDKVVVE